MFTNFMLSAMEGGCNCYDWPVIKQIIIGIGWILQQIYDFFEMLGVQNLGLAILALTLIIKFVLLPLTIKQQKFSKIQMMIQPEMKAIQRKYQGRRDQFSQQEQQAELKELYAKYGTSQTGGCLQSFIQMPILIALYGVIRFIPTHVHQFSVYFENILKTVDAAKVDVSSINPIVGDLTQSMTDRIAQMSTITTAQWNNLMAMFSGSDLSTIQENYAEICRLNNFCGIDLSQTPWNLITGGGIGIVAIMLPIIAGVASWLSFKLTQSKSTVQQQVAQTTGGARDPMDAFSGTNKSMGLIMPLFSVFICFTIQSGVGLYWAMSYTFQVIIQIFINKHYRKIDMEEFKKENMEKAAEKSRKRRERQGEQGGKISQAASINTKNVDQENKPSLNSIAARANVDVSDAPSKNKNIDPNSLAAKTGLVQQYEEETGDVATNANASSKKKYKKK